MIETPEHDWLDIQICGLPNDATVQVSVVRARALVDEAKGIEEDVITDWMKAVDP